MGSLREFFGQRNRRYRDFQIVFTILTLNFIVPAISYSVAPEAASLQLERVAGLLGDHASFGIEAQSRVWRHLGAANVMTLGIMCLLMQIDLRKYFVLLAPLTFLKAYNATLFLVDGLFFSGLKTLLAIAAFDYLTSAAFVFFSIRAHRELQGRAT
jgi:hypothetical protein